MTEFVERAEANALRNFGIAFRKGGGGAAASSSSAAAAPPKKRGKPLAPGKVSDQHVQQLETFIRTHIGAEHVERCFLDELSLARRQCSGAAVASLPRQYAQPRFMVLVDTKEPTHLEMVRYLRRMGVWAVAHALECGDYAICEYRPPADEETLQRVRAERLAVERKLAQKRRKLDVNGNGGAAAADKTAPPSKRQRKPADDDNNNNESEDDDEDADTAPALDDTELARLVDESALPLSALGFYHTLALIERKAVPSDLWGSIKDGRRRAQLEALRASGVPIVVWLYVGYIDEAPDPRSIKPMNSAVDHDTFTLHGAVRTRQVRSESDVPFVLENAVRWLAEEVLERERAAASSNGTGPAVSTLGIAAASLQGRRKAALSDPDAIYERALCTVPGVSDNRAAAIRRQCYPTMMDFMMAVHSCVDSATNRARVVKRLASVRYAGGNNTAAATASVTTNGKKAKATTTAAAAPDKARKLGPKVAERLVDAFLEPYVRELNKDAAAASDADNDDNASTSSSMGGIDDVDSISHGGGGGDDKNKHKKHTNNASAAASKTKKQKRK